VKRHQLQEGGCTLEGECSGCDGTGLAGVGQSESIGFVKRQEGGYNLGKEFGWCWGVEGDL